MAIWRIFLNATLRAAVHLGQDCEANFRYVKNNLWNSVGQVFNENEKLIGEQTEITGVTTIGFAGFTWMSTSLLCEKACQITNAKALILLQPGRAKLNGIRKTITSRMWIESLVCRWSSSGKYSQESQGWASSRRFKVQWQIYSVNRSTSMTGSFSCQWTMTLCGENEEIKNNVNTIHRQLRSMLVKSLAVVGLSWDLD